MSTCLGSMSMSNLFSSRPWQNCIWWRIYVTKLFISVAPVWRDLRRETVRGQDRGVGKDRPWSRLAAPLLPCGSASGCWGTRGCSPWQGGSDPDCTWSVRSFSCWLSRLSRCSLLPGCGEALLSPNPPSWSTAAPPPKGTCSPFFHPPALGFGFAASTQHWLIAASHPRIPSLMCRSHQLTAPWSSKCCSSNSPRIIMGESLRHWLVCTYWYVYYLCIPPMVGPRVLWKILSCGYRRPLASLSLPV